MGGGEEKIQGKMEDVGRRHRQQTNQQTLELLSLSQHRTETHRHMYKCTATKMFNCLEK